MNNSYRCPKCGHSEEKHFNYCSQCGQKAESSNRSDDRIIAHLRQGQYIQAIKLHREQTGADLKSSKEYVDRIAMQYNIQIPKTGAGVFLFLGVILCIGIGVAVLFLVR